MASSSANDLLTSSGDVIHGTHEVVHQSSKGKERMFEPSGSTTPPEAHESSLFLEVELNKGYKHNESEIDTNKKRVPEVSQVFASEEEAYEFYNAYAQKEGFNIRKDQIRRWSNGKVCGRCFTCSKAGHRKKDHRRVNVKKRRAETRTGCMARLVIKRNDSDTWVVKEFIADHNHLKVIPSKMHLLRSQRRLKPSHVTRMTEFEDVEVPVATAIQLMAKEAGGKENLGITEPDYLCESRQSFEVESNRGNKYVELKIDTNKNKVPELGQVFASEEEAYEFYNAYGLKEGFSIRKDQIRRWSNGKVCARYFACSNGGHRKKDHRRVNAARRHAETRTGCMARLLIRRNKDDTWFVKEFIADHNHPKVTQSKTHLLRSQRRPQPTHVARTIDFKDVGVPLPTGIQLIAKEAGGKENLGLMELHYRNFLRAGVGVVKDSIGNPIQAKPNTDMGLRYGNLCRIALNLVTRGAVSEEAYLVAASSLEKALEDVEAILKRTKVTTIHNSIQKMNDGGSPMDVTLDVTLTLAQGNERDRPTNDRVKSCLESERGRKRSKNNVHTDSGMNRDQPKQRKRRKGRRVSVEERNNDLLVNPSCPEELST